MDKKKVKKPVKMFDFSNPESPPIIIDGSPLAPSKVSSSCGSHVAHINDDNERKNRSPEEVLSPCLPLILDLFPTQTSTDIQESSSFSVGDNNGSNQHQEIAPATLQGSKQESAQTSTSDKTHVMCMETKRSSCNAVPKKNEQPVPRHEEEEKRYEGISTELVLYEDPWKIKKKLKPSDLGHLSRLLLPRDCVKVHVLQWMGAEMVRRVQSREGMDIAVRDVDTGDEHQLVFRYWASSNSYLLNGEWNKQFVRRRGLEKDDEIGMLWDTNARMFHFTVLHKVACGTSNAAA